MQTFDQSIFGLLQNGLVTYEEALRWASKVDEFKMRVQGIHGTGDSARDQMASTVIGSGGGTAVAAPPQPEITRFGGR
jgi:Tfp pilus assembly ATPase PilU